MSMPDVTNGLQKLRKARQDQDDLIAAAEEIDRIGGIERAAQEAEQALAPIIKQQDDARAELEGLKGEVSEAEDELKGLKDEAATADAALEQKFADAQKRADKILSDARLAAKAVATQAEQDRLAAGEDIEALRAKRDELQSDVDILTKQITEIQAAKAALLRSLQ